VLLSRLKSPKEILGEYTERQAKASAQKADLEVQLQDAGNKLTLHGAGEAICHCRQKGSGTRKSGYQERY
jgi:hypothetical protein